MADLLKILFVCSEAAPFVKTGGLADVAGALPKALRELGHDVRIVIPRYARIDEELKGKAVGSCSADIGGNVVFGELFQSQLPGTDIPVYLVGHDLYFFRDKTYGKEGQQYDDNLERFCFFSLAALDGVSRTGWAPDVVHCHDWHTAVAPAYIKTRLTNHPVWGGKPTVFTIHNVIYQGRFNSSLLPRTGLGWELFTPDYIEFYGDINLMKAGIGFADKVNTVSPTHAQEILTPDHGRGLDGYLRARADGVRGILNGVDYTNWNPATDAHIAKNYTTADRSGKAACKRDLRGVLNMPALDVPVFGMVSRLLIEKGSDLLILELPELLKMPLQLVVLGVGAERFVDALKKQEENYPDKLRVVNRHDEVLAHKIYAGADFFVMPSLSEACGIAQMYALAYGAVPVVRRTGGLADTVTDASPENVAADTATGLVFDEPSEVAFGAAVRRAVELYAAEDRFAAVQARAMKQDFSWERSAKAYVDLYREAIG